MRAFYCTLALLVIVARDGTAQGVPRASLRDSNLVTQNVLRLLFDGISLGADREARATEIIRRTWREQFALPPGPPGEHYRKSLGLNARRDSLLRSLLKSEADREQFDRNRDRLDAGGYGAPREAKRDAGRPLGLQRLGGARAG